MLCLNCMKEFDEKYGVCPHCGFIPGTPPKEAYHLYPGTILRNRYIVGTTVGFGGFGITYRAWDSVLSKKVAVKEYYPNGVVNRVPGEKEVIIYSGNRADEFQNGKSRFLDEARNMARFNTHPNIVNVYEFFEENNTAYIAMEFLEGMSYKQYIAENGGKVAPEVAVGVVLSVLDALKEIHRVGIIHRDVSPDNIFMVPVEPGSDRYKVKLIDFGAARFSTGEEEKTLSIILKPGYAPPEQYRTRSKQGPWTDIYAVGAVLYRSVTGVMPEESVNRVVEDHMAQPVQYVPELPQYLNDSVMRAMALSPELRFRNVDQFREALQNQSRVLGVNEELKRRKRIRGLCVAGIFVVLLGAGLGCAVLYRSRQNAMYGIAADISVMSPDINGEREQEIKAVSDNAIAMADTGAMLASMKEEYASRFRNVNVNVEEPVDPERYTDELKKLAESGNLPSVLETTGITKKDTEVWNSLGSLDTTYKTISGKDYYFVKDEGFQAAFLTEKKQIPISFCAPVLYVNTFLIRDESLDAASAEKAAAAKVKSLSGLSSVSELTDKDGKVSFCVSSGEREMYREAFREQDQVDGMEEFDAPEAGEKGYQGFVDGKKAYYLGTTDDYEVIRASKGGIYSMVVMTDLQKAGKVKGQFTHLWSIDGSLTGDAREAADDLVYYLMSENAQDVFNLQNGNGLSMNRTMLETYVDGNSEFKDVKDGLDDLQMDYSLWAE